MQLWCAQDLNFILKIIKWKSHCERPGHCDAAKQIYNYINFHCTKTKETNGKRTHKLLCIYEVLSVHTFHFAKYTTTIASCSFVL